MALLVMFTAAFIAPSFAQINWSNRSPAGITDAVWCVTYANRTFAAVTDQGNLLSSSDGLTWSSQTIDEGVWLVSIAYGNGTWVVVGDKGTILTSTDLKTWVRSTAVTTNRLNGVLFGPSNHTAGPLTPGGPLTSNGSLWCAVGEAATIITSPDAQTWTVQPIPYSPPGDAAFPFPVTGFLHGITWDQANSAFLITGEASATVPADSGGGGVILRLLVYDSFTSNGGLTSSQLTLNIWNGSVPLGYPVESILGGESNFVAVGGIQATTGSGHGFIISGLSPTASAIPNVDYRGLANGNGYWVAAGEQGAILSSNDGMNWTQRFSGDSPSTVSTATLLSAAYSPTLQRFIVTGTGGTILVSNSAPTVFGNVSTRGYVSSTQTFIGGFVIEGSAPRTVLIRADGPVLSTFNVPSPLPDPVLTVYDNNGNVVATNSGWSTTTNPTSISTAALEVGAFALPNPSLDSALLLTLPPGAYTAQITSAKGNAGIALFEAYTD